jgi:hypothetical protein
VSVLVVVLAMLAVQQGGDGDESGPLNAIAEAAEKTQEEPGGRAIINGVVVSPDPSKSFTMSGETVFNDETERTRGVIRLSRPGSDDPLEMRMVTDGATMYMRSELFGSLPDGDEWMSLDLSLGGEVESPVPGGSDATEELELLEEVTGDVHRLGEEEVRGVQTTHYRGTVAVSDQVEDLREEGAEDAASFIEDKGTPTQVEAWIDDQGLVRRTRIVKSQPPEKGEAPTTIAMRLDFVDLDLVPDIDVPDSDEVFDATALMQEEIGSSSDE